MEHTKVGMAGGMVVRSDKVNGCVAVGSLCLGLLVLLLLLPSCNRSDSWPPAVGTAEEIRALPADQRSLRCIGVGDAEVLVVAERLKSLDYLYLNSDSPITDSGATAMQGLASLKQLVINDGSNLTDASCDVFASMPALEELMLSKAAHLTDAALIPLAGHSRFRRIYLEACPGLSSAAVDALRRALPECEIRTQ